MVRKHLLIAIEGIDGVGKTTVANALAIKLGAVYLKTPTGNFLKRVAFFAEKLGNRELEAVVYFVLAVVSSLYFRTLLRKQAVVCDKYILVTLVDQAVLGSGAIGRLKRFRYVFMLKPDFTFCLQVSEKAVLIERLRKKEKIDHNDSQLLPLWREIQEAYQEFPEVVLVDTTLASAADVVIRLLDHINNDQKIT